MPTEKQDPLSGGYVSKFYMVTFPEPITGYDLAKTVYNVTESTKILSAANKVYTITKEQHILFERSEKPEGPRGKITIKAKFEPYKKRLEEELKIELHKDLESFLREAVGKHTNRSDFKSRIKKYDRSAYQFINSVLKETCWQNWIKRQKAGPLPLKLFACLVELPSSISTDFLDKIIKSDIGDFHGFGAYEWIRNKLIKK